MSTLQTYVLVSQDQRSIRVYRRLAEGGWSSAAESYSGGQTFTLPALSAPVSVDEVYEHILDAGGRSLLR